jgi:hypothetical protein
MGGWRGARRMDGCVPGNEVAHGRRRALRGAGGNAQGEALFEDDDQVAVDHLDLVFEHVEQVGA